MSRWFSGTRRVAGRSWVWCAAVLALALVGSPALAIGPGAGPGGGGGGGGGTGGGGGGNVIPEINPGSAAAALTLLAGATLIVLDRRRKTKAAPEGA